MAILIAPVATAPLAPIGHLVPADQAAALGYPATLFGYTPAQPEYWREPGLPCLTQAQLAHKEKMPLDCRGRPSTLCIGDMAGDHMAPRFPRGCAVHTMPVFERTQFVVGKVYTYLFRNQATGETAWRMARLLRIGDNYLEVKPDNDAQVSRWLLRDEPDQATWDVREVTHYVSYPGEDE